MSIFATSKLTPPLMIERVQSFAWAKTSLGPMDSWATSVRVAINMVMASSFPKCLCFGKDLVMIYNDAFIPILGAKGDSLGLSFRDVWREAWDTLQPIAEKTLTGTSTFIEDFELNVDRHGFMETAYFTFCYSPVCDETGKVIGLLDTVVETTQKVLSEHKLRDFAAALEQEIGERIADQDRMWRLSVDLMAIVGPDSRIKAVNPAFSRLLGWSAFEVENRPLKGLIHPEDRQRLEKEIAREEDTRAEFRLEARMLRKDGHYIVVGWSGARHDKTMLAIGRDLTADYEAAEALRLSEIALRQAQKMESIGRLTGGVAHDFNNLLQVISGNLQLLSLDVSGHPQAMKRLDNALAGVTRGAKLASHLLAFSRKQALEPAVLKLGRAVLSMNDMLSRTLGEEIDIEIAIATGLWNTFVDTAQVENALLNLCINARDAMEGCGKLTIEVSNAVLDEKYASEHQEVSPGQYVMLAVSDTGSGMSAEIIEKVFEPFFTTKPEGKGTGLGLSMVFGFVKQSGGHIKIYSEVGHGTTIKLYLPRSLSAEESIEAIALRPVIGGSETVLVVEDDVGVQATVVDMLKALGYRVLKANDASSALTIIESGVPIDILFTDVIMPGPLRSPELAQKARESLPNIAVLFTSGYTENAIVHGGRLDEGVELLGKPYTREALARKIRHVLANQQQCAMQSASSPTDTLDTPNVTPPSENIVEGERYHIVFVEDNDVIRHVTTEMLEALGHQVVATANAEQALDCLDSDVTVLITDIKLPGISGEALALQVRNRLPNVAIIMASGGSYSGDLDRISVLSKPYNMADIAAALREAHELVSNN